MSAAPDLGLLLDVRNDPSPDHDGWLLLLHGGSHPRDVVLPPGGFVPALDSTTPDGTPASTGVLAGGTALEVAARSLLLLRRTAP